VAQRLRATPAIVHYVIYNSDFAFKKKKVSYISIPFQIVLYSARVRLSYGSRQGSNPFIIMHFRS
jgi:hypothetical protein